MLTYRVPYYHVVARRIEMFGAPLISWVRSILIGDVYRSIGKGDSCCHMGNVPLTCLHSVRISRNGDVASGTG